LSINFTPTIFLIQKISENNITIISNVRMKMAKKAKLNNFLAIERNTACEKGKE